MHLETRWAVHTLRLRAAIMAADITDVAAAAAVGAAVAQLARMAHRAAMPRVRAAASAPPDLPAAIALRATRRADLQAADVPNMAAPMAVVVRAKFLSALT